jgi:hypothetical protein
MFKRILLLSGVLSVVLTALVYFKWMVPKVDVVPLNPVAWFRLPDFETVEEGSIVTVQGFANRSGTTLLGKQEVLLADSAGQVMVMCTFVVGATAVDPSERTLLKVKGVWHPFGENNSSFPVVLAEMTDCVLLD